MADLVRDSEVDALADELTRARQRGLSAIEERGRTRRAVTLPLMEQLAAQSDESTGRTRVERLREFLDRELSRYAEGSPDDAALIRQLFQDPEGRWPGPLGPGYLLDQARSQWGPPDKAQFRRVQRRQLLGFARFILGVDDSAGDTPNPTPDRLADEEPADQLGRRHAWVAPMLAAAAALAVLGVIAFVLMSRNDPKPPAGSSQTSTHVQQVMFRFDALGSTETDIIQVYPGAQPTPEDRTPIGTYNSGTVVKAVCVTTGRLVRSDPKFKETPKESDQWVRIDYVAGVAQYATLTYGELIPANARLPACPSG